VCLLRLRRLLGRFSFRSPQSRRREVDPTTLPGSSATLAVIPSPLMEHWKLQIQLHTRLLKVYFDCIDGHRLRPLPPAKELAKYDLVVIPKERLTHEWTHHRPCCALEVCRLPRAPDGMNLASETQGYAPQERTPRRFSEEQQGIELVRPDLSELLRLRWLRVVVDEGHSLGSLGVTAAGRLHVRTRRYPSVLTFRTVLGLQA
jgi:hypothetical protein